jgi:hypothetical protein
MKKNVNDKLDESISKSEITEGINEMLECLFSQEKNGSKKCKECEKIDACRFLMDSVFVYKNIKRNKIGINSFNYNCCRPV